MRKRAIACLAAGMLACGSFVSAADNASDPKYLADAAAPARKPLMSLLDQAGVAKSLDDLGVNVYGHIEGSWTYSASNPPGNAIAGRSFDFEDQDPTLNQIDLTIEKVADLKKAWDVGFKVEWIYGADARLIHSVGLFDHMGIGSGPDNQWDLTQAYIDLSVPVGNGLLVRAGKFVTMHGAETINPTTNPLYSRSYLFNFAIPFTHTGILGTYQINDQWTVTGGVTRGWNTSLEDNNDVIDAMLGVKYQLDAKTAAIVNVMVGPEQTSNPVKATKNPNGDYRTLVDVVITHVYSDQLSVMLNADYGFDAGGAADGGDAQWYGVALYGAYKIDSMFTANARAEWYHDEDNATLGAGGLVLSGTSTNVYEATLGVTVTPFPNDAIGSNLKIRPEVRVDYSDDPIFDGGTDEYQVTFGVDAFFTF